MESLKNPGVKAASIADLLSTIEVHEFSSKNNAKHRIFLTTGFRESTIKNPQDWLAIKDTVEPYRVDIVYSKYPLRGGMYPEIYPLLFSRLVKLFQMDPALNSSEIKWNKVLQTNCVNDEQVGRLFHGIVIWYHTQSEWDSIIAALPLPGEPGKSANEKPEQKQVQSDYVNDVMNTDMIPDSVKNAIKGLSTEKQKDKVRSYLEARIRKAPDVSLAKASAKEVGMMKHQIEEFLSKHGSNDVVVSKVLDRHAEWQNMVVVNDWTGSMYQYGAQVLQWHVLNYKRSGITTLFLFNDGDEKSDHRKVVGETGGIYHEKADNISKLLDLFHLIMLKGNGGDGPENDIEAILEALETNPDCTNILLIADHNSCVRDIELADRIRVPVKIILCGYLKGSPMNPDYVYLAKKTNGGIYTIEEDIEFLNVTLGEKGTVLKSNDERIKLSSFRCGGSGLSAKEEEVYTKLPESIKECDSVYRLDLSGQALENIPRAIYKMKHLKHLNLSENRISSVSSRIEDLKYLKSINLSGNNIRKVPNEIKEIFLLSNINLSHNQLEQIPAGVLRMRFLKSLDLSENQIGELTNNIMLQNLEYLNLSGNKITRLPKTIGVLRKLAILDLSDNQLIDIPLWFTNLTRLKELNLAHNQLKSLPHQITRFRNLKVLNLRGNSFSETEKLNIRNALPRTKVFFD
jgi:hypothetical protein